MIRVCFGLAVFLVATTVMEAGARSAVSSLHAPKEPGNVDLDPVVPKPTIDADDDELRDVEKQDPVDEYTFGMFDPDDPVEEGEVVGTEPAPRVVTGLRLASPRGQKVDL
jgi:hypothetical protein